MFIRFRRQIYGIPVGNKNEIAHTSAGPPEGTPAENRFATKFPTKKPDRSLVCANEVGFLV